ncbi:hypothetical protein GGI13_005235 [Coemansia sp. RSA 455]|nr:hypothetical protein LPJ71_007714 [Coemansia sp. S17]KAJ2017133.1 hypothetical protein GGI14_003180 [Coemansia sp. S680]KAJ2037321.1 hypothetical protein H4S03_003042 [Coemansia sp. S3946]KAJ2045125.1 hypothetical protein GGI08_006901 [Coemansia sp. S2]KAJ2049881.1 hypothetical protein H4S04_002945 [Coemansia sp. S16]KAJ2113749.1 hypothetical protein IW146_003626 [Coemansia sp. RSA 922]KAJ2246971.1 hypothetical protein GGI13_005235 [Coemansia sp. RSA 455]KAJ2336266.1 hypothetical protein 
MRVLTFATAAASLALNVSGFIDDPRTVRWNTLSGKPTQLVGHRGEKAFMPEHTRASYWQAAVEGADYIEPDLGLTKDGHLVVNHNEWLSENTNVASIPQLAHLRANKTWNDDGKLKTVTNDWFIADMTLEQIKMLRVNQAPFSWRPQHFNGMFDVLTFEEYLQIMRNVTIELGRPFGVIPELKSPLLYNRGRSYPRYFEDRAILTMRHYGWTKITKDIDTSQHADLRLAPLRPLNGTCLGPSAWQSFDQDTAAYLSRHTSTPVVALNQNLPWFFTPKGLDRVSKYAQIVSPWKDFFVTGAEAYFTAQNITWNPKEIAQMGGFIAPDRLAKEIHKRGMTISPYTFYDSHQSMSYLCQKGVKPGSKSGFCPKDKSEEFFYFFGLGMDFMFVENIVEANVLRILYTNKLEQRRTSDYIADEQ